MLCNLSFFKAIDISNRSEKDLILVICVTKNLGNFSYIRYRAKLVIKP